MSDDDLIRRGDALDAAWEADSLELSTHGAGKIEDRINAIPAVQPTVSPDVAALVEALRSTLNFIENTEGEMGVILGCGNKARAALARVKSKEGFSDEKGVV